MLEKITKFLYKNDFENNNLTIGKLNKDLKVFKRQYKKITIPKNSHPNFYEKYKSKCENYEDLIDTVKETIELCKELNITITPNKRKRIKSQININLDYIEELIYIIDRHY